jgi:hypothetical protein
MLYSSSIFPFVADEGNLLRWESEQDGHRLVYELIPEPQNFNMRCVAAGDYEIIELYKPAAGHILLLSMIDDDNVIESRPPIQLDQANPVVVLEKNTKFIMDGTLSTEQNLGYTCLCLGEAPLSLVELDVTDADNGL